ncbi:MAG: sulfite exporter TauE/SafE family protein [Pseudonocardia sp.]|nr:sulfite exporter TauE/SafE family protein [Pseudonocardia sp.]
MAGLASLFSYPALLAAGLPAVAANVTNTVALTVTSVGAAAGSRPELTGQWPTVRRFAALTALGGALGAALLLITPPGAFEKVVPVLIGGAGAVLLFQPQLRAAVLRKAGEDHRGGPVVLAGILAVAVYGGYFGAAAGVLLLALLLVALPVSMLQGNAIKNVLLGVSNAIAAIGFALFAPVDWWAVLPLAAGALLGARLGPVVARHLPPTALRIGIALAGLGLAVVLAVQAW